MVKAPLPLIEKHSKEYFMPHIFQDKYDIANFFITYIQYLKRVRGSSDGKCIMLQSISLALARPLKSIQSVVNHHHIAQIQLSGGFKPQSRPENVFFWLGKIR